MKIKQTVIVLSMLALTSPLAAQMGMGRMPNLSGIWHPVVGSGGSYEVTNRDGKKSQMEITLVGQEDVAGKSGYWMEMAMAGPNTHGDVYVKTLISPGDAGMGTMRMIMQMPGQDPMEMDMNMNAAMRSGGSQNSFSDIRDKSEHVGTETITVPAGTFVCEHYRAKDGTSDVWISEKVAPWGLVKTQGKDTSMVLTKVITDAKDHITGTPKKFDPMQMMRDRQAQQPH